MEEIANRLKWMVHEMLGDKPSLMFLSRIDRTLDEGATDKEALLAATARVEKLVNLFICVNLAEKIGCSCREVIGQVD